MTELFAAILLGAGFAAVLFYHATESAAWRSERAEFRTERDSLLATAKAERDALRDDFAKASEAWASERADLLARVMSHDWQEYKAMTYKPPKTQQIQLTTDAVEAAWAVAQERGEHIANADELWHAANRLEHPDQYPEASA